MKIAWWHAWLCVAAFAVLTVGLRFVSEWLDGRHFYDDDSAIFRVFSDVAAIGTFIFFYYRYHRKHPQPVMPVSYRHKKAPTLRSNAGWAS